MSGTTITVSPTTPRIGAEIGNIDLMKPLTNQQVEDVYNALLKHQVIFFRDQPLDFESHKRFASYFGELHVHAGGDGTASQLIPEDPVVRRQHFDKDSTWVSGEVWHTDQSCLSVPPMGSILYQKIVPPDGGGDTCFASMYGAYEALSPRMQKYLEGLTATHDGAIAFAKDATTKYPVAVHPVIVKHPDTGRKLIYVNRGFTGRINELPEDESAGVLRFLFDHCAKPHWQVRFRWTKDSIAFWDNRCTQHFAIWDYWPNVRSGFRVQTKGKASPVAG